MMKRASMRIAFTIAAAILLVGCQSMSDLKPGDGRKATITGRSYDEIWEAALRVADEHFEIREQDRARGVILAERTVSASSYGAWIGTYITPPIQGAPAYTVEVVRRKKMTTNFGEQDWEYKVLRDIYRQLGLPALDPSRYPLPIPERGCSGATQQSPTTRSGSLSKPSPCMGRGNDSDSSAGQHGNRRAGTSCHARTVATSAEHLT